MNDLVRSGQLHIENLRSSLEECVNRGIFPAWEAPVEHFHANGLYGRKVYGIPAGTTIITKVHLSQHITIALKGVCTVYAQDGVKRIVRAGEVFITEPGTQRAIYCHDDQVEWLTVHASSLNEVADIEHELFCDNFKEYDDRFDYKRFLIEFGLTESIARLISESTDDQTTEHDTDNVTIKASDIQGKGVFAAIDFAAGDYVGLARVNDLRTQIGRYTNHSIKPNCVFEICDNSVKVIAKTSIYAGEEITVDYRNAIAVAHKLRILL